MKFGLEDIELQTIADVFKKHHNVTEVILFGSRAMGKEKPGSDIDLAVKGDQMTFDNLLDMMVELDNLELLLKFDVINYSKIQDPEVISHIKRVGKIIYPSFA